MKRILIAGTMVFAILFMQCVSVDVIWSPDQSFPDYSSLSKLRTINHGIHTCDEKYRFLHGASVVVHKGTFYCTWGASGKDENDSETFCIQDKQ